jgi:transcriptional regulator with XRE-family HTH domain
VENGHTVPAIETLEKMAGALEVPLYQLFYDGEEPPQLPNLLKRKSSDEDAWGSTGKASASLGRVSNLSPRAARSEAQPILDAVNHQTEIPEVSQGITLAEFLAEWRTGAAPSLKPSTREGMESSIRAHLLSVLGDVPFSGMDACRIQGLIESMKGRSRKTCLSRLQLPSTRSR